MKAAGPKHERETVILFNDEDDQASVWTASQTVYNRMLKRGWLPGADGERSAEFIVPKSAIKLPLNRSKPRKPRGFAIKKPEKIA